jgi:hypothetical protein
VQTFSVVTNTPSEGELPLTIHQIDMVQANKLIGNVGNDFTNILELDDGDDVILTNTTLTNLILAINKRSLYILEKIGVNNTDLNVLNITNLAQPLNGYKT